MPTIKQINKIWDSEYEFFGSIGSPKEIYGQLNEGHGLIDQKGVDTPLEIEETQESEGEVIGILHYDEESNEITFTPKGS